MTDPSPLKTFHSTLRLLAHSRRRCCPPSCGLVPSRPKKDPAVGAGLHFKQSYNTEKLGFTRNVSDYLLYISTLQSTK